LVTGANIYVTEKRENGTVAASVLVSGPDFDRLTAYAERLGIERYMSAYGYGWRKCRVLNRDTGELVDGFELINPSTPEPRPLDVFDCDWN
jgi:hypothetical protein